jgi:hypothetical protein
MSDPVIAKSLIFYPNLKLKVSKSGKLFMVS